MSGPSWVLGQHLSHISFPILPQGTEAAKLFVNQLVSSRLNWRTQSVVINMKADMYAPGNGGSGV